jgi:hypothetical protein
MLMWLGGEANGAQHPRNPTKASVSSAALHEESCRTQAVATPATVAPADRAPVGKSSGNRYVKKHERGRRQP